jgi:pantoate--beta-alanine ligase
VTVPEVIETAAEVRARVAGARGEGKSVGFVPTLGALHAGHAALMRRARAECGYVVVSIFINPTQFAPGTDYERYPRDLAGDVEKAGAERVDLVFAPPVEEVYPPGDSTVVEVTGPLVECLCGPHRPGHFRGVTTVCAKLFGIVGADRAYFGEKDYQQLLVIKRMVRDLRLPLEIVPVQTVRDEDGVATSSRNSYLSPEQREAARVLSRGLFAAEERFAAGERDAGALVALVGDTIAQEPRVTLQYAELRDAETLEALQTVDRKVVLALAAFVGEARLIDNVLLSANLGRSPGASGNG